MDVYAASLTFSLFLGLVSSKLLDGVCPGGSEHPGNNQVSILIRMGFQSHDDLALHCKTRSFWRPGYGCAELVDVLTVDAG